MESRVKLLGHPVHPMLIVLPLGLFITAIVFDILYLATANSAFPTITYYNIIAGIAGGLLAAVFGLLDWLKVPSGTRAKSIGLMHGGGNVVVVTLFAISWLLRGQAAGFVPGTLALLFSFAGGALGLVTGWLGGELVDRLGVGVDPGANLNAPSSLSGRPAAESSSTRGRGA